MVQPRYGPPTSPDAHCRGPFLCPSLSFSHRIAADLAPLVLRVLQQKASASVSSALGAQATGHHAAVEETVESQILKLAGSLGVKCVSILCPSSFPSSGYVN